MGILSIGHAPFSEGGEDCLELSSDVLYMLDPAVEKPTGSCYIPVKELISLVLW